MCLQIENKQQIYQALQCLQPSSVQHPTYSEWQQVTRLVEQRWPFMLEGQQTESQFGQEVCHTLLYMGYQTVQHHDAGDGLHRIDTAFLPQSSLPLKVAVEADGENHYLYEDCRLQGSPEPATRSVVTDLHLKHDQCCCLIVVRSNKQNMLL